MTLVVFDIDGTLLDSNQIDADCYLAALQSVLMSPMPGCAWSAASFPKLREKWMGTTLASSRARSSMRAALPSAEPSSTQTIS